MFPLFLASCVGDDIIDDEVDPDLRITNPLESLKNGDSYDLNSLYFDNVGIEDKTEPVWTSSDNQIATVNDTGLITGVSKGNIEIIACIGTGNNKVSDTVQFEVGDTTIIASPTLKFGTIQTTSQYKLQGSFTIVHEGNGIKLSIGADYDASTALPGLYVYLSNNPQSTAGAHEIGAVQTFKGAHDYIIPSVSINSFKYVLYFCKPFNVKVGDGLIKE